MMTLVELFVPALNSLRPLEPFVVSSNANKTKVLTCFHETGDLNECTICKTIYCPLCSVCSCSPRTEPKKLLAKARKAVSVYLKTVRMVSVGFVVEDEYGNFEATCGDVQGCLNVLPDLSRMFSEHLSSPFAKAYEHQQASVWENELLHGLECRVSNKYLAVILPLLVEGERYTVSVLQKSTV